MDNNKKIKELEKQIEELKKNQDGLYRYIRDVEHEVTRVNLKSIYNESRIKIILNNNKVDRMKLKNRLELKT